MYCMIQASVLPFLQTGDFVVGNRRHFYQKLIPHASIAPRIPGGHLIQYDNPRAVSFYIQDFLCHTKNKEYDAKK